MKAHANENRLRATLTSYSAQRRPRKNLRYRIGSRLPENDKLQDDNKEQQNRISLKTLIALIVWGVVVGCEKTEESQLTAEKLLAFICFL